MLWGLRIALGHSLVVVLVSVVLLSICEESVRLLDIHKGRVIRVLVGTVICKETISNFLIEVLVVSHSPSSELSSDLGLCSIEDSQELVTTSLCEPDLHSCRGWNEAIQRHYCQLKVV